jgi:hypothetical protein
VLAKHKRSILLLPKSAIGLDSEPVPSTFSLHKLISLCSSLMLSCHLLGYSSWHFLTRIFCGFLVAYIPATCPAHCTLPDFTVLTALGDWFKLQSSLLCNILKCSLYFSWVQVLLLLWFL